MPSEANARVLSAFLDYLRIEKGLAQLSINAYLTDIRQFAEFLEKNKRTLQTARRVDVRERHSAVRAFVDAVMGAGKNRARLMRMHGQAEHPALVP